MKRLDVRGYGLSERHRRGLLLPDLAEEPPATQLNDQVTGLEGSGWFSTGQ